MVVRLIILTTSSKQKNLCIAGVDVDSGLLVRLVTDIEEIKHAIPVSATRYQDGSVCSPMDVVEVPIINAQPLEFQPENILVDLTKAWVKVGRATLQDVINIHPFDDYQFIFGNDSFSVHENVVKRLGYSLAIVEVENFELFTALNANGQIRSKCRFSYRGHKYNDMSVTDPLLYSAPIGYKSDKAVLVISIPNDGPWFYKFVSKAFFLSPHP